MPDEISSDHNIIQLDLDISTDRRQAKLTRPTYNLGRADWEKLCEELTRTIKSFEKSKRSHDRIHKLDNQGL